MKKYNLSKIMKKAWAIKKENQSNIFSFCLRQAWQEAKKGNEGMKVTVLEGGKEVEQELNLRRDVKKLAAELNISEEVATKLAAMEVLSDSYGADCRASFKNWKNRRIYFTMSNSSNNQNGRQRYFDLTENVLKDGGLSYLQHDQMVFALNHIQ